MSGFFVFFLHRTKMYSAVHVSIAAEQREEFKGFIVIELWVQFLFCVEFASFSHVCMASLLLPWLLQTIQRRLPQSNGLFPLHSFSAACLD